MHLQSLLLVHFPEKLYDAKGHSFVIIPGVIITFTGIILLSYTTTIPSLIIAAACYGSGFGAIQPALQAWMIDRVAPHRRGVATATFFSAFDLGIGAGAIILDSLHILQTTQLYIVIPLYYLLLSCSFTSQV